MANESENKIKYIGVIVRGRCFRIPHMNDMLMMVDYAVELETGRVIKCRYGVADGIDKGVASLAHTWKIIQTPDLLRFMIEQF